MTIPLEIPFVIGETGGFTERLIQRHEPWLTSDFEILLDAIGWMFEPTASIAEEEGEDGQPGYVPPYGVLMDPVNCPAPDLPWLGQFVGVEVPVGATESEARAFVKAESGQERGTVASVEALLGKALGTGPKGEKLFVLLERTQSVAGDNAYWLTILVPSSHLTPGVYEELNRTVPAGIMYTVVEKSGTWFAGVKKWSAIGAGKKWSEMSEGNY